MTEQIPQNFDAERMVISSLALDPMLWKYAMDLDGECFAQLAYRAAFEQMADRVAHGRTWLPTDWSGEIASAGAVCAWSFELEEMCRRLLSARVCRAGMSVAKKLAVSALALNADGVEEAIANAKLPGRGVAPEALSDIAERAVAMIVGDRSDVIRSDISIFDKVGILRRKELCILAARPSVGKSQLACDAARNVASWGQHVVIGSFEMAAEHVLGRMAGPKVGFGFREADTPDKVSRISTEIRRLGELTNLTVIDRPMSSMEFFSECRRIADVAPLDLVVVDHVRLLTDRNPEERHRLGNITRNLREIGKELDCSILVCAQLNRGVEARENQRPTLADLRDSGEIEEGADTVAFIYRKAYHSDNPEERRAPGTAEVWVAKNRNGGLGGGEMFFDPNKGPSFSDIHYGRAEQSSGPVAQRHVLLGKEFDT